MDNYMKYNITRCPTIEDGRDTLQTNLQEHPKLLVVHTGTNNLTQL